MSVEGERRVPHAGRPHFSSDNLINIFLVGGEGALASSQSPHNKKSIDHVYTEWCLTEWCTQAMSPQLQNKCCGQAQSSPTMALGALGLLASGVRTGFSTFPPGLSFFPALGPSKPALPPWRWVGTFFLKYEVIISRDSPQRSHAGTH